MPEREKTLTINEIYESIQGESTWAGLRCVFVRLTFCDLRCTYCDTEYAFYEGKKRPSGEESSRAAQDFASPLVEITGGEPLLQKKRAAADDRALRRRRTVLHRNQRRARHLADRPARASHHGPEDAGQR